MDRHMIDNSIFKCHSLYQIYDDFLHLLGFIWFELLEFISMEYDSLYHYVEILLLEICLRVKV